jgi:ATP diphosphatase
MPSPDTAIADLLYLMVRLRDPVSGCPWDLQQDYKSLVRHTLEECFELADTIERDDFDHLKEELGDVLFQVVFYSQLASEQGRFEFAEVVEVLLDKLLRRHPHVFPDGDLRSGTDGGPRPSASRPDGARPSGARPDAPAVAARWDSIKQQERAAKSQHGLLADIPLALPALTRAGKLQKRASGAGFDWQGSAGVLAKLREEAEELQHEIDSASCDGIEDELGDLLFTVVNLARHLKVDPETALRRANRKFEHRFNRMEQQLATEATELAEVSHQRWQQLWQVAKRQ